MNWEVRTMRSVTSCFNSTLYRKNPQPLLAHLGPVLGDLAVCPAPQSAHHDPAGAELGSGGPCAQPGLFFPGLGGLLPELGHGAGRHLWPAGRYGGVQLSGCQPLRLHDARPAPAAGGSVFHQLSVRAQLPAAAQRRHLWPHPGRRGCGELSGSEGAGHLAAGPVRLLPLLLLLCRLLCHVHRPSAGPACLLRGAELPGGYHQRADGLGALPVSLRLQRPERHHPAGCGLAHPSGETGRCCILDPGCGQRGLSACPARRGGGLRRCGGGPVCGRPVDLPRPPDGVGGRRGLRAGGPPHLQVRGGRLRRSLRRHLYLLCAVRRRPALPGAIHPLLGCSGLFSGGDAAAQVLPRLLRLAGLPGPAGRCSPPCSCASGWISPAIRTTSPPPAR